MKRNPVTPNRIRLPNPFLTRTPPDREAHVETAVVADTPECRASTTVGLEKARRSGLVEQMVGPATGDDQVSRRQPPFRERHRPLVVLPERRHLPLPADPAKGKARRVFLLAVINV
jgi:hypothetical protein